MSQIELSEDELKELFKEGVKIMNRLRMYTKAWEERYGVETKERKKYWEAKMDTFLEKIVELKNKNSEI